MPLTDYSRETRLEKEFDFGQGVSKYYMPDTSWMTQLQEPTYLGTSGVVTEGGGLFSHGTPHWADQNIGEAKYKFDYSKLFGEDSQISSLINMHYFYKSILNKLTINDLQILKHHIRENTTLNN